MKPVRTLIVAAFVAASLGAVSGCSVIRGQESAGAYADDAGITAQVKAKLIESKAVDAGAVNVQTMHGEVALSGFAKSTTERDLAAQIARQIKGVRTVHNNLVVRP